MRASLRPRAGHDLRRIACAGVALLALAAGHKPARAVVGPSVEGSPIAASIIMLLSRKGSEAGFCTATVLTPRVLMTAAHCVPPGADLRVHFPAEGKAPVLLPVKAVLRHPGYRPDAIAKRERSVDLALVRLPAPLPNRFAPATLATGSGTAVGRAFTLSGYGLTREGEGRSSGTLRSATLAAREPLSALLLWAEDPTHAGAGACTGDSGAPMTQGNTGIVAAMAVWSAGPAGQDCGDLTQALWIGPERGWIDDALQRWAQQR